MLLVNYKCEDCEKEYEELFNDSEEKPDILEQTCTCGGKLVKFNLKKNCHRVYVMDPGGLE